MFQVHIIAATAAFGLLAASGSAQERPTDAILDLLALPDTVAVMRKEGLSYGDELGQDMLSMGGTSGWAAAVDRIYDTERMEDTVRAGFAAAWAEQDAAIDPLITFFSGENGQRVVQLEISARDAMAEPEIEDAARAAWIDAAHDAETEPDMRLDLIADFIETNDLIEANVVGAMNSSFEFYLGLVDGGGLEMTEDDILREVWSSEAENREDTREWLNAYMLMAYRPLEIEVLQDYVALAGSQNGRALNRALFAGFDRMYSDISYALGRALARQMTAQDL